VFETFFHEVHHYVGDYGYLAVGLGIFLEDFGLPTPGETLLVSGAVLASHGTLDIRWLLLVAWLAAVTGDSIGFFIGRTGGQRLLVRHGKRFGITEARFDRVTRFVNHYGVIVIVAARFVVVARQLNGIVAGSLGVPWARFFFANALGAALWVGFWGTLAYWLGRRVFEFFGTVERAEPVVVGAAILGVLIGAIYVVWHRRRSGKR
jgi:membrane protein DedA with SNARE-associated domain